ncbi:low-density lipoprotein receptor-related protein 3 [Trichomycterus rosablanca]|uniref:low-density lipoprotein receptor-related protein 3 n=1 Tax=Trichomycterus rosablanca TaxID=2290929 RepID=UPI002F35B2D3
MMPGIRAFLMKWCFMRWAWICLAACDGKVELRTERRGVIYSPSWPHNYPAGVNCSWNIQGNRGEVITISFHSFDVEESEGCRSDWLLLSPTLKEEYRVCGSSIPRPFIFPRGGVWLHFHSHANSSGLAQGFRLSYVRSRLGESSCESDEYLCGNGKCVPRSWRCNGLDECGDSTDERSCAPPPTPARVSLCPPGTLQCTHDQSTRCLPFALRCNGVPDCPDGSDEAQCPDMVCGKRMANFYGMFASPDFFHPNRSAGTDLYCTWFLDTQDPKPLTLRLDLQLGAGDSVRVYDGLGESAERLLQSLTHHNNQRPAVLESSQGRMSVLYHAKPHSQGHGFNASYQVKGYCFPGEIPCGPDEGCYSQHQRCDGYWHCPGGRDEEGCALCPPGEYPCQGTRGVCYTASERCDNQKQCPDGSDEKNCFSCQPGTFHCSTNLCILETWRCDGQEDCADGSDEHECEAAVPRRVITAALIGSLACGLLLVIALSCAFKLYSLRTREYRAFETQMTQLEADFVQREAPPSYGQLIAQGLIPPVEDFPVYNPTQASVLHSLRSAMRRQMRRHSARRTASRRRLGRLWSRLFHRGSRLRSQILLLTPPEQTHNHTHTHGNAHVDSHTQPLLPGRNGYRAVDSQAGEEWADLQAHAEALCLPDSGSPSSPSSPVLPHSSVTILEDEDEPNDEDGRSPWADPASSPRQIALSRRSRLASRKAVQGLALELGAMPVTHYTSLTISPRSSSESLTSSSSQNEEDLSSPTHTDSHAQAPRFKDSFSDFAGRNKSAELSRDTSSEEDEDNILVF